MKKEIVGVLITILFCGAAIFLLGWSIGKRSGRREVIGWIEENKAYQQCIAKVRNWGDKEGAIDLDVEGVTITGSMFREIDPNGRIKW